MPCTTSQTLRKSGATTVLRPGAEARTPFGTPFFKLVIDPETETGTFVKRRLDTRMREEIMAWEKLQRTSKLPENREYAGILQRNRFAGDNDQVDTVDAPTTEGAVGGGFVVGGEGCPSYFVPGVDGPGDSTTTIAASTDGDDDGSNYDDRLWPDTYAIGSDSDIDYILDGFVVIDMADATGSVFSMNNTRLCGAGSLGASGRASLAGFAHKLNRSIVAEGHEDQRIANAMSDDWDSDSKDGDSD